MDTDGDKTWTTASGTNRDTQGNWTQTEPVLVLFMNTTTDKHIYRNV